MDDRRIELMHELFGERPNDSCKNCKHLISHQYSRKYYKCDVYGETSSDCSDWKLKYTACGLYPDIAYNGIPIIKMRLLGRKRNQTENEIECQMSISDFIMCEWERSGTRP